MNPLLSRLSACLPDLIKRLREEAYRVAGRPEAAALGWIIFSALPATTLARRAGEFAALPPLSDRAFRHAVQERQVGTGVYVQRKGLKKPGCGGKQENTHFPRCRAQQDVRRTTHTPHFAVAGSL